jgi:hypothetical protein
MSPRPYWKGYLKLALVSTSLDDLRTGGEAINDHAHRATNPAFCQVPVGWRLIARRAVLCR